MTSTTKVPFLDLVAPHQELKAELMQVVEKALGNAGFIGGPMVEDFEREFAKFCAAKYCVGVNSGTDALRFRVHGCRCATERYHYHRSSHLHCHHRAISQVGAQIVFVDIHEQTYTMDPDRLREYLEQRCEVDGQDRRACRARLQNIALRASCRSIYTVRLRTWIRSWNWQRSTSCS